MKKKKILIVYLKERFESQTALQAMYHNLMKQLKRDGHVISKMNRDSDTNITSVNFEDGTVLEVIPFGKTLLGKRFDEIYIEEKIKHLKFGSDFISEMLIPLIAFDKQEKHLKTFGIDELGLFINKYK